MSFVRDWLFFCRRPISSEISSAESSCTKRSSSIFASSSAIGCSNSRNVVFIGINDTGTSLPTHIRAARIARRLGCAILRLEGELHVAPLAPHHLDAVPLRLECRAPLRRESARLDLQYIGPPLVVVTGRRSDGREIHRGNSKIIEHAEQHLADNSRSARCAEGQHAPPVLNESRCHARQR